MFNFDIPRYEKVVGDAIALRPQIEKAVDEICSQGYTNIYWLRRHICPFPSHEVLAGHHITD